MLNTSQKVKSGQAKQLRLVVENIVAGGRQNAQLGVWNGAAHGHLLVDMAEMSFMSSSGLVAPAARWRLCISRSLMP